MPARRGTTAVGLRRQGRKERVMSTSMMKHALALGFAGALALGAGGASAAPVSSYGASLKAAAPSQISEVRWRGRAAVGAGIGFAAGAIIGSAIAGSYYGPGYYDYGYGYDPGYYDPGYAYVPAPVYAPPPYRYYHGYRWGCVNDEGYGRFSSCNGAP